VSILSIPSLDWSDAIKLDHYRLCPKSVGLYAIGEPEDPTLPITPAIEHNAYLGRWPENFRGLYIGISLAKREGIRGRLRSHYRGKGCKGLHAYLANGTDLHFIHIPGHGATNYEAAFIHIQQPGLFPLNDRSELKRYSRRFLSAADDEARAAGREIINFAAIDGYCEDG
jgi:hypothetical protein